MSLHPISFRAAQRAYDHAEDHRDDTYPCIEQCGEDAHSGSLYCLDCEPDEELYRTCAGCGERVEVGEEHEHELADAAYDRDEDESDDESEAAQ